MFWFGFLFGDENRKLKELEQRRKYRQVERDKETLGFMVEELQYQLAFMEKNNLESLTFTLLNPSKFNYSLLSQALSKIGSKIAYTRLEKFEGKLLLTLYKNRPEAISRLYRAYILRLLLWFIFALIFTVPVYLFSKTYLDLLQPTFFTPTLFAYILTIAGVSVIWICANMVSALVFRYVKFAEEFKHTVRFNALPSQD